MDNKRAQGRYFTQHSTRNALQLEPFRQWMDHHNLWHEPLLEPFAGSNNLITMIRQTSWDGFATSYDIMPAHSAVVQRDTLKDFPLRHRFCLTNPPWLARNSATRRHLPWSEIPYDDLYKHCVHLCLKHCDYVAAFLPASFLQSHLHQERLEVYILLHDPTLFVETDNPCCLALFSKTPSRDIVIWYDDKRIGTYNILQKALPQKPSRKKTIRFNDPKGFLGLIAFDNTKEESIRFCDATEIASYTIKVSSRFITRISGACESPSFIEHANSTLRTFRRKTHDLFLTPFKGLRADGRYRRRLAFDMAYHLLCSL